jgi:sulfotransferase
MAKSPPRIFYQSSLPRAGSTLLQNILAQNPDFYVTPTSGVLELIFGARLNSPEFKAQDFRLMQKGFLRFCRDGLNGFYSAVTDKPYVVDKSRGWGVHYDLLQTIFDEDPKIICMVRDLREIISSFEKKFRQNPDLYKPIENHSNMTGNTTIKRTLASLQSPPVGLALDRLLEVHQRGFAPKMLFIRFEDLTRNPAEVMKLVYNYLEVPHYQHNFKKVEQVTQEDDTAYGIRGLHDIRPEVKPLENSYLQVLGQDSVRIVEQQFAWYFQRFGYRI